jgi:hypothetical protein
MGSSPLMISRIPPLIPPKQYIFREVMIKKTKMKPNLNKNGEFNFSIKKRIKTKISRELRIDSDRKKF